MPNNHVNYTARALAVMAVALVCIFVGISSAYLFDETNFVASGTRFGLYAFAVLVVLGMIQRLPSSRTRATLILSLASTATAVAAVVMTRTIGDSRTFALVVLFLCLLIAVGSATDLRLLARPPRDKSGLC